MFSGEQASKHGLDLSTVPISCASMTDSANHIVLDRMWLKFGTNDFDLHTE